MGRAFSFAREGGSFKLELFRRGKRLVPRGMANVRAVYDVRHIRHNIQGHATLLDDNRDGLTIDPRRVAPRKPPAHGPTLTVGGQVRGGLKGKGGLIGNGGLSTQMGSFRGNVIYVVDLTGRG